jgi:mRNA interferase RelE/StbE
MWQPSSSNTGGRRVEKSKIFQRAVELRVSPAILQTLGRWGGSIIPLLRFWQYTNKSMKVVLHPIAGKYLTRLDETVKERIKSALKGLEHEPPEGDIKPMVGQTEHYRLRIGNYRVLYRIKYDSIFVTHIEPRGQAYNKKTRGGKR